MPHHRSHQPGQLGDIPREGGHGGAAVEQQLHAPEQGCPHEPREWPRQNRRWATSSTSASTSGVPSPASVATAAVRMPRRDPAGQQRQQRQRDGAPGGAGSAGAGPRLPGASAPGGARRPTSTPAGRRLRRKVSLRAGAGVSRLSRSGLRPGSGARRRCAGTRSWPRWRRSSARDGGTTGEAGGRSRAGAVRGRRQAEAHAARHLARLLAVDPERVPGLDEITQPHAVPAVAGGHRSGCPAAGRSRRGQRERALVLDQDQRLDQVATSGHRPGHPAGGRPGRRPGTRRCSADVPRASAPRRGARRTYPPAVQQVLRSGLGSAPGSPRAR